MTVSGDITTAAAGRELGFPLVVGYRRIPIISGMQTEHSAEHPVHEPSEAWLRRADERCRAADIRPCRRPWFAVKDYAGQRRTPLRRTDPAVERIFAWFRDNAQ